MGDFNRHARYKKNHVPKKKKTTQLYGEGGDTGKWFKCWYCGEINNTERSQVADVLTDGGGGQSMVQEYSAFAPNLFGVQDARYFMLVERRKTTLLREQFGDGTLRPIDAPRYPNVTRGCTFCGSQNYR